MSFNKTTVFAVVLLAGVAGALACGPNFPWQLLDDRDETMSDPVALSFPFEARRLLTVPADGRRAVERDEPTGSTGNAEPEAVAVERGEARSGAWQGLGGTDSTPDALVAKLEAARRAPDGDTALAVGAGLPPAVVDYVAGAIEFRADRFEAALRHFEAIDRLPPEQRRIRLAASAYMQGRVWQRLGDMARARSAFEAVRRHVAAGAPDPMGLGVASLGEEARTDLVEAGLVQAPWPVTVAPDLADATIIRLIGDAVRLYAEQAARGSKIALLSLREVAERLVARDRELTLAAADPLVRRLIVAYVVGRQGGYPWDSDLAIDDIARVIEVVADQPASDNPDDLDRLAALAYQGGRYNLAERLTAATTRPLGLWVRAKLALRRGDRDAAARDWMAALTAADQGGAAPPFDAEVNTRLRGEMAVMRLSQGEYSQSLRLLFPVAGTYWGDVAYIAERALTIEELKAFVDALPPPRPATPEAVDSVWSPDFVPADRLRLLLARRLVRDGRVREAIAYFPAGREKAGDQAEGFARAEEASSYLAALGASQPAGRFDWPWQRVSRAEAVFRVATLDRRRGMELMGTEGPPDEAVLGGNFPQGFGQSSPDGVRSSPSALLGPDEAQRFAASAPKPDTRFHYRGIAADRASAAADLLPQRSQAYAATLCWAARYAIEAGDQSKADAIYRRYVANGAYQAWATDFGQTCPEPDFEGARTFWQRRFETWLSRTAGSFRRHIAMVVVSGVVVAAGLLLVVLWRQRTLRGRQS
jgi:tetratricopeptide (TPR) repeat protein